MKDLSGGIIKDVNGNPIKWEYFNVRFSDGKIKLLICHKMSNVLNWINNEQTHYKIDDVVSIINSTDGIRSKEEIELRLKQFDIEDNEKFGIILFEEMLELQGKKDALKWVLGLIDEIDMDMNRYSTDGRKQKVDEAIKELVDNHNSKYL